MLCSCCGGQGFAQAVHRHIHCHRFPPYPTWQEYSALLHYLRAPPVLPKGSLLFEVVCFQHTPSCPSISGNLLLFGPSFPVHIQKNTMTSADFWQFSHTSLHGLLLLIVHPQRTCQTSPGKSDRLHPVYPPHLLYGVRAVLDFVLYGKLVRSNSALYAVLVHRVGTLPPASFRFHLTMDTLAFG